MAGTTGLEPAASAVTETISLVTNRKYAARMALWKRFSEIRKQFVDCKWTIISGDITDILLRWLTASCGRIRRLKRIVLINSLTHEQPGASPCASGLKALPD